MSLAFMDVRLTSLAGVQSVRGLLYLIVSEVVFTHSYAVFHTFPAELPIYLRESHLYSSSAYYVGKVLATVSSALGRANHVIALEIQILIFPLLFIFWMPGSAVSY